MPEQWRQVPCAGCGCLCDDVTLSFDGSELVCFEPTCRLGEQWFRAARGAEAKSIAEIAGQAVNYDAAVQLASGLLQQADAPLVYGLAGSATAGQRAAIALAECLGGVIDTPASLCHGPSIMALQEVGEVTSTLGEVRNRADLVVFWGCHPAQSHPRHAQRYSVFPHGRFTPAGRTDRTVVMVGDATQVEQWDLDPNGAKPDWYLPIEPGCDFEALTQLRLLLRGAKPNDATHDLQRLLQLLRGCRYGVIFFGLGLAATSMWDGQAHPPVGHINVAALLSLVADLNASTRIVARRMRLHGDISGADNVLCWQTGYPFGVDFSRGYPRYNPGEFTANELLERNDVDLCLLVGTESVRYFSARAQRHLQTIPTIVLDHPGAECDYSPNVRFHTAAYGLHAAGTAYRMDNVPFSLRALQHSHLPTDERVLADLNEAWGKLPACQGLKKPQSEICR